ncbi:ABC transporter substrate-binding protein [Candidatus Reidiella endopervernicosa]|uniref:ABC transporter substrate-binding protein n=1 Tax=Candidatus Reidiella endopervernicosa TaxID=2738883 RepID=A0A6N0HVL5_9GAMM|nr:ABC transporter substrate-binding protein [Candidatus Reidiella endopervernicosa]QKQ26435.1 ABC transporter substrate-binding protein [Candidatus Reidiella endopervernicosa]
MSQITIMPLRHSAFYSPLLMTMAGGFLKKEGLEAHYRQERPGDTVVENIQRGSCDLAQSAVATSFAALEAGELPDIVHFAQINNRDGFFIAAREPDADFSWRKLMGRQVLVDHFFQPMAMLKYGLHRQGVDYEALQVVDAGEPESMLAAFLAGRADYLHLQGPAPQQLEHDGKAHVVAAVGDAVGPVAYSSLCASREWLQGEKAQAQAFMRAYRKSQAFVLQAPAEEIAAREQALTAMDSEAKAVSPDSRRRLPIRS